MTDQESERRTIRDAMDRLLNGEPLRSDGKLTIKSLADEAGVKRWILTHRHQDLQDEFRARIAHHGNDPEPVRLLKTQLHDLQQENQRLRAELRQAKTTTAMLERLIAVEALETRAPPKGTTAGPKLRPVN